MSLSCSSVLRRAVLTAALIAAGAAISGAPSTAQACGGLFCGAPLPIPAAPEPVDQTAERIIFEMNDDGTISAHVNIAYEGAADDFAWIVPVPEPPVIEEGSLAYFTSLFEPTNLSVVLPAREPCPVASGGGGGGGGGCGADSAASSGLVFDNAEGGERITPPPVRVVDRVTTENYEATTLEADTAGDLVLWLQDNNYNVSDNMVPVMTPYVDAGMAFVTVKLREGRLAEDIVPITMTYTASMPMVPIQLTAVAARPLMGISVIIVADEPYQPANYEQVTPRADEIFFDQDGNTTYFEWVARQAAEADGHLWVTEFVGRVQSRVISRFYTRIGPEHMTLDPIFEPDRIGGDVSNVLDLSNRITPFLCGGGVDTSRLASSCAFNYCGPESSCGLVEGRVACDCADGDIAQTLTGPDGSEHVTCVPAENPFGITAEAGGSGSAFDPCNDIECGAGVCIVKSGFPACECQDDAFACLEADGSVLCVVPPEAVDTFGPGAGPEAGPTVLAAGRASTMPASGSVLLAFFVLLGVKRPARRAAA
ncbi:MAG: hypothetical protein ACI81R_003840 [Bradymonadia bacterium]|jgi:hypothetical protein